MAAKKENFLVEIQTEELPPKQLGLLASSFLQGIKDRLLKAQLEFKEAESYVTPRRLAVMIKGLSAEQPETEHRTKEALLSKPRLLPKVTRHPRAQGFARSCGVTPDELSRIKTTQGEWVGVTQVIPGKSVFVVQCRQIVSEEALTALPIHKRVCAGAK